MWKPALCALLAAACSPQDVLNRQGSTLRSTDFVQTAIDEKRTTDQKKEAEEQKKKEAAQTVQAHADRAQAHIDLGEYESAATEYKEAYRLSQDPAYLIKIGDAVRATGDCVEAQNLYTQYLNKRKDAPDAKAVSAKATEAAACEKQAGTNLGAIRQHYKDGNTHYDLAEYDKAAAEFKEAYRLSQDPAYLFNIAQAYRLAKKCDDALTFYQRFLAKVPDAQNRAKVEQHITDMKACSKSR